MTVRPARAGRNGGIAAGAKRRAAAQARLAARMRAPIEPGAAPPITSIAQIRARIAALAAARGVVVTDAPLLADLRGDRT